MTEDFHGPLTDEIDNSRGPGVPAKPCLLVLSGPDQGRKFDLAPGVCTIGKSRSCTIVLTDGGISREHLELEIRHDGIVARDRGSKNGSYFQGARFREVTVGAGAVLTIGTSELKIVSASAVQPLLPSEATQFGSLVGRSLVMRQLFAVLERVAPSDASVLIEGETGVGKELCAESIHAASTRCKGPFVVCDLAGVTRSLMESELFGHRRGAFTGADRDRDGAFVDAQGGTIFIDEIGELELEAQPRLLRALGSKKIKPVGDARYRAIDARVIAATNRNLEEECAAGRFRQDLYHRLAIVKVRVPPLRERKEDLPLLVERILGDPEVSVSAEAMLVLTQYDWPGNVRELRNVIDRARSIARGERVIGPAMLGLTLSGGVEVAHAGFAAPTSSSSFHDAKEQLIAAWERAYLSELMQRAEQNVSRAARDSGLHRPYLHRLLKKHGIGEDR